MTSSIVPYGTLRNVANPADKSPIQKWITKISGAATSRSSAMHHAAYGVRQYGEAGIVGMAMAAVESYRPQDADKVLALTAIGGAIGSIWQSTEEYATDLRNIGSDAFVILSYKKGLELINKKRMAAHGEDDMGEDAILDVAKDL